MTIEVIHVPDLGGADNVVVIELTVAPGDVVEVEQTLLILETDKATMDVPSPMAGTVVKLLVDEGATISEGDAILELDVEADAKVADSASDELVTEPTSSLEEKQDDPQIDEPQSDEEALPQTLSTEQTIQLPDIGSDSAVDVLEVVVSAGDTLAEGDSLMVLETDKATMDIPSPMAGELVKMLVSDGDKVNQGDDIAVILSAEPVAEKTALDASSGTSPQAEPQRQPEPAPKKETPLDVSDDSELLPGSAVYAGPAARQLARELGVDLRKMKGTGPRGRILKEDLQAYLRSAVVKAESGVASAGAAIPPVPDIDFSQFGEIEDVPLTRIQQLTAANMQRSWLNVPHVTQFDEADITELEDFRKTLKPEAERRQTKVTPLPFLLKACAYALQGNPVFNRSISADAKNFTQKKYIHIGVAVDTPQGLMVPVVRNVDQKSLWQLADDVSTLAEKARDGKLTAADMKGGCFTISSLGAIGGNGFTPIVNAPEVGILGVSKSQIKPVWDGEIFAPRLMLPLSLSYDHRVVNGADCGRFFACVLERLSDVRRLAL